jgi:hypothetical protein
MGSGVFVMAAVGSVLMLAELALSRASPLPHWYAFRQLGPRVFRGFFVFGSEDVLGDQF